MLMCLKQKQKRVKKQMIILNKGETTTFVATLWELSILTAPNYLFVFTSEQTKVSYFTIISDTLTNESRYNKFNFTEGVNDALNGSLVLGESGFYSYTVYEQNSATNLEPSLATGIVERGKMKLMDSANAPDFTQHTVSPATNIVYNPS